MTTDLLAVLNKSNRTIVESPVDAAGLGRPAQAHCRIRPSPGKIAKDAFEAMVVGEGSADEIVKAMRFSLVQITDESSIVKAIEEVMAKSPEQVAGYRGGKDKLFGFFVGQVMKATQGKANPDAVNRLLKKMLDGLAGRMNVTRKSDGALARIACSCLLSR